MSVYLPQYLRVFQFWHFSDSLRYTSFQKPQRAQGTQRKAACSVVSVYYVVE